MSPKVKLLLLTMLIAVVVVLLAYNFGVELSLGSYYYVLGVVVMILLFSAL